MAGVIIIQGVLEFLGMAIVSSEGIAARLTIRVRQSQTLGDYKDVFTASLEARRWTVLRILSTIFSLTGGLDETMAMAEFPFLDQAICL